MSQALDHHRLPQVGESGTDWKLRVKGRGKIVGKGKVFVNLRNFQELLLGIYLK